MQDIQKENKSLKKISKILFGASAWLEIVNPKDLVLLKENARYFKKETFQNLVENIKEDNRLSSMPLCCIEDSRYLVLSGNHRVKAAIEADIKLIIVMVLSGDLSKSEKIATQLSHNALVGLDDMTLLKSLWDQVDDLNQKIYAGLSSETVKEIENINFVNFSTPPLYTKNLIFAFTETEKEYIDSVLDELRLAGSGDVMLSPMEQYQDFFDLIQKAKKTKNIKNASLALLKLCELAGEKLEEEKCHS
ncbi:MAG: ParB N-terminal domain-containing protein [Deltaproteobacteria bacterium]|nr:ParB N-terminal domain-containing protein [Deltaproteobacteria bacterium]